MAKQRYYLFGSRIPNGIAYYDCEPGSSPPMQLMYEADVVLRARTLTDVIDVTKNRFGAQEVKRLNPPSPAEMQPIQSWDVFPPVVLCDEEKQHPLPELLVIDATSPEEAAEKARMIYAEQCHMGIDAKSIDVRPATTWQDDENPYDLPECIVDPMDDIKKAHDEMLLLREKILRSFEGQVVVTGRPIGVRQKRIVIADNEVEYHYQGSEMTSGPNIVGVINSCEELTITLGEAYGIVWVTRSSFVASNGGAGWQPSTPIRMHINHLDAQSVAKLRALREKGEKDV